MDRADRSNTRVMMFSRRIRRVFSQPSSKGAVGRLTAALALPVALALTMLLTTELAHADHSTIKNPGDRTDYVFEAEPHVLLGAFDPPGVGRGTGVGLGFRGTVQIVENGFIKKINNSIGITFGLDWLHYAGSRNYYDGGRCTRWAPVPAGPPVCVEVDGAGRSSNYVYFPVAMQWNFWFTQRWSAFGEVGAVPFWRSGGDFDINPMFAAGGRVLLSDRIGLTMRLGYPTFSLGVSFLL